MNDYKKLKLDSIQDEVKDFHPLIHALLPKLPNVKSLEHTHGANEMGADFVFSSDHQILGNSIYIGVIVKIGKINQDIDGIERQIDECFLMPRPFNGGKEKIYINEVWVITNTNITKNAQEKINAKYKSHRIEFIQGDRLRGLIDDYFPEYWTETSILVGEYLSNLRNKNKSEDEAFNLGQFSKPFYVDQDLYEYPRLQYRKNSLKSKQKAKKINVFDVIDKSNFILVEGGAGSGKTKLLRHLISHYTTPDVFLATHLLPIYTTYKALLNDFKGNIELLIYSHVKKELQNETAKGKYLVFIDAFDETRIDTEHQVQNLSSLWDSLINTKNAKVVVTSRYLPELDRSNQLENIITRLELVPLSLTRTIEYLNKLCSNLNTTSRLLEDLRKSNLFRELPRSPISAILLAKLINENPKDLPSNLTELYAQYIEVVLGRWEIEKGLQSQKEYQALDNILIGMAQYSLDYEMLRITLEDVKEITNKYLSDRRLDISSAEILSKIQNRCDILSYDSSTQTVAFKHRTFAEFFYAKGLTKGRDAKLDDRAFDFYWLNTNFFYFGILKDCPELVEKVINLEPKSEGQKWLKIVNLGNYLLAAYTTPYSKISAGLLRIMFDASKLFVEISSGKTLSPLTKAPHMELLYLTQFLIRNSYSFSLFKDALETAALAIDASSEEELIKQYALFFTNVAYIELGEGESFDFLLKNHLENLELDIALAISHESVDFKTRTELMKKQEKKIAHLLKNNRYLVNQLRDLYEQPIQRSKNARV